MMAVTILINMLLTDQIKQFYSTIQFPGTYTMADLKFYDQGIFNIYLKEIDNVLTDNIKVLDIGCGTGLISNLFASRYCSKFTAIDFSNSIDFAQLFAIENNINNVRWIKEDILEFETNEKYDVIICCGVLHHIPEHQKALDKMKSLLTPGGTLILAVYNKYGKILKKHITIDYQSNILYEDQENNPFELGFSHKEVLAMCDDLRFQNVTPSFFGKLVNLYGFLNPRNGGLVLYTFNNH